MRRILVRYEDAVGLYSHGSHHTVFDVFVFLQHTSRNCTVYVSRQTFLEVLLRHLTERIG